MGLSRGADESGRGGWLITRGCSSSDVVGKRLSGWLGLLACLHGAILILYIIYCILYDVCVLVRAHVLCSCVVCVYAFLYVLHKCCGYLCVVRGGDGDGGWEAHLAMASALVTDGCTRSAIS